MVSDKMCLEKVHELKGNTQIQQVLGFGQVLFLRCFFVCFCAMRFKKKQRKMAVCLWIKQLFGRKSRDIRSDSPHPQTHVKSMLARQLEKDTYPC